MTMNRRDMLRWGTIGAGAATLSSAANPAGLPAAIFAAAPILPPPPVPPKPIAPAGIDPQLFGRAKAALDREFARGTVRARDFVGIDDFSQGSREARFHVVNMMNGSVESNLVAHGRGSDPGHSGYLESFSNTPGSEASSNGAYATSDYYHGKYGLSMRVRGLDWTNNNAESRAIVIHNAWYAEPDVVAQHGKLGRSEGCFAFSKQSQWAVMNRLAGQRLIFADKLA
jgi:hypothetical protein